MALTNLYVDMWIEIINNQMGDKYYCTKTNHINCIMTQLCILNTSNYDIYMYKRNIVYEEVSYRATLDITTLFNNVQAMQGTQDALPYPVITWKTRQIIWRGASYF